MPDPVNIADLERLAFERLEPGVHGYFAGGAGYERTLRCNAEAYGRWELRPRVLVDVSEETTRCAVLGSELELPILVAPVAFVQLDSYLHLCGQLGASVRLGCVVGPDRGGQC